MKKDEETGEDEEYDGDDDDDDADDVNDMDDEDKRKDAIAKCTECHERQKRANDTNPPLVVRSGKILSAKSSVSKDFYVLPLDEAIASGAVFVIVSGSDRWADGNAFEASLTTKMVRERRNVSMGS